MSASYMLATMRRLTHHRAKAGSILRTPGSMHRATQPTVPRLSSCACVCGKCIPYTQKAFVRRGCSRALQVGCSCWFQLRSFACPLSHPCSFGSHGSSVTSPFFAFSFLFIPFIIFALRFSLPPSRNSDPGSHSGLFPPPTPYGSCLAFLSREDFSYFFHRQLASNCAYPR